MTIIGPSERIDHGVNQVMDLASSMQMASVDIARQHPQAPLGSAAHARNLTRYLRHRREIERLERAYDAHIAIPSGDDPSTAWEIYSRDGKNNIRARSEIISIVNRHPPARLAQVDVSPFYHTHVRDRSAPRLRDDLGVALILPEASDASPQILLVYEGRPGTTDAIPTTAPSPPEAQEFERALAEARRALQEVIDAQAPVTSRTVDIPRK